MRVLIAEDDELSRRILRRAVEQHGHECIVATDGLEAWTMFQAMQIDMVISDRMLPGLSAIELCRRIRELAGHHYAYFLVVTTQTDKSDLANDIEAGADDYVMKPLNIDELLIRLQVATRITMLHRDLAEQASKLEILNRALFEQGRTDALTQLGNRLRLQEDLDMLGARAVRYGHSYCAVLFDIDCFKQYNDSQGRVSGDEMLRTIGNMLRARYRSGDAAYRYGGEEFLLILPEQTLESAAGAADRVREAVAALALAHPANVPPGIVTLSAGVSRLSGGESKTVEAWLKEAEVALYLAQQSGRDRVVVHDEVGEISILDVPPDP